ncbi:Rv3235 family protein [Actinomycetospora sp. OC33-EN08]|uniref:Rv3235 family protein n=1 Tax=Actinomycetospora aurantiaca TaxID=3129233 RepID=A0ABU8MNE6_9PSEU
MSVAVHEPGPAPLRGGSGAPAGVRPREGRACTAPRLARRMDRRPRPRLRPLHAVLADLAPTPPPEPPPAVGSTPAPDTRAWEAALEGARAQAGPLALRVLAAVAEVLDGRRPVEHLAGVCPAEVLDRVAAVVRAAVRRGGPGTRVRGLRLCPVVVPGPRPVLAVEVAAALCPVGPAGPARPAPTRGRSTAARPPRTRAVAARFELADTGWRLTELVVG